MQSLLNQNIFQMQPYKVKHLWLSIYKILLQEPVFLVITGYLLPTSISNFINSNIQYYINLFFQFPHNLYGQFINILDYSPAYIHLRTYLMLSVSTQTQQFLMLLSFEDKLTMLYQRVKTGQNQKRELTDKIQYLEFKNRALEKSLFQQESRNNERQSQKNQALLHDVIHLEEQLIRCKNQIKGQENKNSRSNQFGNKTRPRNQNIFLGVISEQPEISYIESSSSIELLKTNKISTYLANKSNRSKKSCSQVQLLNERIVFLEKQIEKHEKRQKMIDLQNKRIKKMNEQLSNKCKKLQKLNDARIELYSNLSTQLHSSTVNPQINSNGSYIFDEAEQDSLFY